MTSGGGSGAGGGAMRRPRSFTERSEHPWERSVAEGSGGPERRPAPGGGPERRGMERPRAVDRSLRQGWRGPGPQAFACAKGYGPAGGRIDKPLMFPILQLRLASLGVGACEDSPGVSAEQNRRDLNVIRQVSLDILLFEGGE